jgi:RimJ/RimL family protein N-acetyltransferase
MNAALHVYTCICDAKLNVVPFGAGKLARCPICLKFAVVPTQIHGRARKPDFNLRSARLGIELAQKKHWRELNAIHSDVRNFTYEISNPSTPKETKASIKNCLFPSRFAKSNRLLFRVFTTDGLTIGTISVSFTLPYYSADIGFMFHFDHQGMGYGFESVRAVCKFLIDDLNVERITGQCDSNNRSCRSVFEKIGFVQEGFTSRFFYHPTRGWVDSPTYSLLREPVVASESNPLDIKS